MASTAVPLGGTRQWSKPGWSPRRLVGLEFRRGPAMWLVPVALIPLWFILREDFSTPVALWVETGVMIRELLAVGGPLFGGAAAWVAAREHRRGAIELLATTPLPAPRRWVSTWCGTVLAAGLAGLVIAVPVLGLTAVRATWGNPVWWPVVVGFSALVAHTAVGFAFGAWLPSRFTAPMIAVLLFLGEVYVGTFAGNDSSILTYVSRLDNAIGNWRYLSPLAETSEDLSYGIWPAVGMWQTMWLLGGTGVMLSLVALRSRPTPGAVVVLVASLAVSLGGASEAVKRSPGREYFYGAYQAHTKDIEPKAYVPACQGSPVVVCLHPAYEPWLDAFATRVNRVLAPIADRPGVPMSISQIDQAYLSDSDAPRDGDETVRVYLWTEPMSLDIAISQATQCAMRECYRNEDYLVTSDDGSMAQDVIARWLLVQAGEPVDPWRIGNAYDLDGPGSQDDPLTPYVDRFSAMAPADQQAWFDEHLSDLIAGRVSLADLP